MQKKTIVISSGDPAGIGPWVSIKALEKIRPPQNVEFVLVGDEYVLNKVPGYFLVRGKIKIVSLNNARRIKIGYVNKQSGKASLEYLQKAIEITKSHYPAALVTAPVSKEAISLNEKFLGHTEFLANAFSRPEVLMMMVGQKLKIALLTRHIFLRDVSRFLRRRNFDKSIALAIFALRRLFCINYPRIAVCSFNPHAGVETFLKEEERAIIDVLQNFRGKKVKFIGPYPADTVFRQAKEERWDCIISLYHDQAMIPFRLLEFEEGVNLTVGLPIIRTSPAHGVAAKLLKTPHLINSDSMRSAIKLALRLIPIQNL